MFESVLYPSRGTGGGRGRLLIGKEYVLLQCRELSELYPGIYVPHPLSFCFIITVFLYQNIARLMLDELAS